MRALAWLIVLGCGPSPRPLEVDAAPQPAVDAAQLVDLPPDPCAFPLAGPEVELAAPFAGLYTVHDLGPVPGVPNPLGGTVIAATDQNTLLVAGGSESASGAIYSIGVVRDPCGHIAGFAGAATQIAATPYVDANLTYVGDVLIYAEWPQHALSQLRGSATMPERRVELIPIGLTDSDSGPGGLGRVPPGLDSAGELRLVTWPGGHWAHVTSAPDGDLVAITAVEEKLVVPNEPGGFAYVPAGSPGFTTQSVIVAEWRFDSTLDRVAVYDVDNHGDPDLTTRREFFAKFPRPWGAYFEPVTGDYLFLSWGTGEDHVFAVRGFVPPPLF
jgi:hypothetical protein